MAASNEKCCFVDKKLLTKAVNFENQGSLVDFACGKQLPVGQITLNTIAIKELDKNIKIPVSSKNIERLKEVACKSSIGSARYNIHVDDSEKHEWEISASEICDPTFEGLSLSSLISCFLRLPTKLMSVKAQLKKLMLHKHGGRSCNKIKNPGCCGVDGKFGTAVLQVPVEGGHQGGCFSVEYKGRNQAFENHASSGRNFYITTFFDCCEHFAEPVTQGYQLTLVFDLIWTNAKIRIPRDFPVFLTSLKQVKEALKSSLIQVTQEGSLDSEDSEREDSDSEVMELSAQTHDFLYSEKELKENILFFILHEKYDIENFAFEFLCSQDRKAAELLKSCGFLDVHLAMATHSIKKTNDNSVNLGTIDTRSKIEQNSVEILRLIDSDDVVRNLSIELKSNEQFVGRIEDRFSSSRTKLDQDKKVENRGGNTEVPAGKRNLHHGVLVIWPKQHSTQIYCRFAVKPHLKENSIPRCERSEKPSLSSTTTKSDIVTDKIDLTVPSWAYSPVSNLSSSVTATPPTTPPTGWTTPLIGGPRFDNCDSVPDAWASNATRVGSSSSAISSGEGWVEAAEFKSHERNAAVKVTQTSSTLKKYDWKGSVTYKDMKFRVTMEVFDVNKPTNFMKSVMPLSLEVVGNIDKPEIVWNYLMEVKETIDEEVIFLQCTPTSYADWTLYSTFCKACQDMGIAVLGVFSSPIKDFYLFPILKGRPIPKELLFLSSGINLLENRASSLLLGILVMYKGRQKFFINETDRAVVPYKLVKIDTSLGKMNASNTSSYENGWSQKVIPIATKIGPSSSDQPLSRAVIIRQQLQQDILPVDPIKTKVNAHPVEQFAKTRTTRWSPLQKNVPVAVQNEISAPADGESRMQNALNFGQLTSTSLETIGFHDPTPISKASTPTPNYAGRSTRATSQSKLVAEASKSTDPTNLALVAKVLEPKSVKLLGDSTTSNEEWRRKDDSISGTLSISSSVDTMNANNTSSYENGWSQKVIPIATKTGPSSSDQPLNRAVIIRQQLQQDILRVDPIKTKVNAHRAEPFAKTRETRWSPLQKSVPVAVQNQISAPVDGKSKMQNAVTFRSLTSTSQETIGFHDPIPVSKTPISIPNYEGRLTRVRSKRKLITKEVVTQMLTVANSNSKKIKQPRKSESLKGATKSAALTNHPFASVVGRNSVKMIGESTTSNVERRRRDDSNSGITKSLSISSSSCLPLSSTTSSLRTTRSKTESSLTTLELKSESRNTTTLSDSYSSKSKISRKRSPDSSKEEATTSKVAKTNSESTRTISRTSLKEAMWGRCKKTKDLVADEAIVEQIATEIEESLYSFLKKDAGAKYKNKYRSLIYNITDRNNPELLRDVITKKISPDQLVRMSTEELACKGLAEWREKQAKHQLELIERNEQERKNMPDKFVFKTHKGEMVIENTGEELDEHVTLAMTVPSSLADVLQDVTSKRKSHLLNLKPNISTATPLSGVNKRHVDRVLSFNSSSTDKQKICKTNSNLSTNHNDRTRQHQQNLFHPSTREDLDNKLHDYKEKKTKPQEDNILFPKPMGFHPEAIEIISEAQTAVETPPTFREVFSENIGAPICLDEKELEQQNLMEELNAALPAWLAIDPQASVGNNLASVPSPRKLV